jgi:hypothetical protein
MRDLLVRSIRCFDAPRSTRSRGSAVHLLVEGFRPDSEHRRKDTLARAAMH